VHGTDEPMIRLERVSKTYDDGTTAVHELSLDVRRGELCVLVGPSGSGKTTSLKMVNRLIEPTSGAILIDGHDVLQEDPVQLRRRIGYVIQQVGLFPHQTISENVGTVPRLLGWPEAKIAARATELLALVGLDPGRYAARYPAQLSGGERQRAGVARALAAEPPVMLMDEPFGAVDPIVRDRLQGELLRIQRELGTTILFVTHDIDEAIRLGDRVAIMRDGKLVQYAPPGELLAHPANDFVAQFTGADRGLKRLEVLTVGGADVDTTVTRDAAGPNAPVLAPSTSLRQALERAVAADELADEGVGRRRKDDFRQIVLHEPAVVENGDAVAHLDRFVDIVGHEHNRLPEPAQDAQKFRLQVGPSDRIECAERLVHQHHRRIGGERARHAYALLLPSGQFAREPMAVSGRLHSDQR